MNKADENALTEYWHRETRYVNDKVDEAFKDAQDHAYALGLERAHHEFMILHEAIIHTLEENGHLADGDNCTLMPLKAALRKVGTPWLHDSEFFGEKND